MKILRSKGDAVSLDRFEHLKSALAKALLDEETF